MEGTLNKLNPRIHEYELVGGPSQIVAEGISPQPSATPVRRLSRHDVWHSFFRFVQHNPWMLTSFILGTSGAFGCFAFTYWLSRQVFQCPSWTVNCELDPSVRSLIDRLGLVQGFLSSIYGVCVTGIAYASYQLAETTLWPLLCRSSLTLPGIDRFLAHARGSLASFPYALWHTFDPTQVFVVMAVGIIGILLHVNSTIVGWTFTVVPVATTLQSNHSQGGGMGFGFTQSNPPGPFNGELQRAASMYAAWSSGQSAEMLPNLRDFVLDRNNLTSIGNFTVGAVQATRQINCYGAPLAISDDYSYLPDMYVVASNMPGTLNGNATDRLPIWLRFAPNSFTSWVDKTVELSPTSARTTIMFAALNSTFEGGETNTFFADYCTSYFSGEAPNTTCLGISSLACDVEIDLTQSQACNGPCANTFSGNNDDAANITWIGEYGGVQISGNTTYIASLGVAIAAAATQLGQFIYGAQPCYQLPAPTNTSLVLPMTFSDISASGPAQHYTVANLSNFIDIAAGAMAIAIPQGWPKTTTTITSTVFLPGLLTSRTYALLIPPSIAVGAVVLLVLLSAAMHRRTGIRAFRLGWSSEVLLSCCQGDVLTLLAGEEFDRLSEDSQIRALEGRKLKLRGVAGRPAGLLVQDV